MKIPEIPPPWMTIMDKKADEVFGFMISPEGKGIISKIDEDYLPWEKAKYLPLPNGVTPEVMWSAVKVSRAQNFRPLSLKSKSGQPFRYWLTDFAQKELHELDFHSGGRLGLDTPGLPPEAKERYLVSSLMEEAIASSMIEGAATTRLVAKEMLRTGRNPQSRGEQMVMNNYKTIRLIKEHLGKPLDLRLLNEIHRSMTLGTLDDPDCAGRFRTEKEHIQVIDDEENTILHEPPVSAELPERMARMCAFANGDHQEAFIHPIIKAIILHLWLAYDHPYVDGNGRMARGLFYWYALSKGYWLMEYLSVSRIILKTRRQYLYSLLHTETDELDATYFIHYHLRSLNLAMMELRNYLEKKQGEYRTSLSLLQGWHGLNYRQLALLQHAIKHPDATYTFQSHRNSHGIAYGTAHNDLMGLLEKGLLEERKSAKTKIFIPARDLKEKLEKSREG